MVDEKTADSQITTEEVAEEPVEETAEVEEAEETPPVDETPEDKEKREQVARIKAELGVPDKPKKKNTFQDRIGELTKQFRTAERKQQELEQSIKARDAEIELARKHNEQLMATLTKQLESPTVTTEEKGAAHKVSDLRREVKSLMAEQKKARAEMDYEKNFDLQDRINVLQDQIAEVLLEAANSAPKVDEVKKAVKQEHAQETERAAIDDFYARNEWFHDKTRDGRVNPSFDPIKRAIAIGLESDLKQTWKGTYPELLKEVEKKLVAYSTPKAPAPKIPAVQGTVGVASPAPKEQLSAEQRRVAHALFPNDPKAEDKYAGQLKFMGGRR